jgi:signal peptidase I
VSERDPYEPPHEEAGIPPLPAQAPSPPSATADHPEADELPKWLRPAADEATPPPAVDDLQAPTPAPQPLGTGTLVTGAVAGLVAAVAGAAVWGFVAGRTGDELDILAWGVGLLVGAAIRLVAGRGAHQLQVVGVLSAIVGILLGKYLVFETLLSQEWGFDLGIFSSETFDLFLDDLGGVFGAVDFLWIALAVGSAWLILVPRELLVAAGAGAGSGAEPEYHTRNPVDRFTRRLPRGLRVTVDWLVTIVGAIAIVLLVKAFVVNPYRIPSSSMEPTLHCARPGNACEARFSDRVLANRFIYHFRDPQRGEIAVFETPPKACGVGGTFVKRVIGLPGEKLEIKLIRGDGYVFIDGKRLEEPYVRNDRRQVASPFGPITVPKDHYFMLGDNREQSCDSREWGALPRENLIGKVFATYWPPQRLSLY